MKRIFFSRLSVLALGLGALTLAHAASLTAPLSLDGALQRLHEQSDRLRMADADIAAAQHKSDAARFLKGPKVELVAKQVWGTKTIDASIDTGLSSRLAPFTKPNPQIQQLPPSDPRRQQAEALKPIQEMLGKLAGGFDHINVHHKMNLDGPRVSVDVMWPLYTGGLIEAQQENLKLGVAEAVADRQQSEILLDAQTVGLYYGVQLAQSLVDLRTSNLADENRSVERALSFEKKGVISKVERLSVEVSRDKARTELDDARTALEIAQSQLRHALRLDSLPPLNSPLFVLTGDLGSLADWQAKAQSASPILTKTDVIANRAQQGVIAADANFKPKVFAFGSKNLVKHYLSVTEPDWIAGVGVSFTLWDNLDRSSTRQAAVALTEKAQAAQREAREGVMEAVEAAWLRVREARQAYELSLGTTALAKENLRLREAAFAQGLATATDVDNARTKLLGAEVKRRAAAFTFDVSWVTLHAAAGQMSAFAQTLNRSDLVIEK